ncbi:MAG: oxidoreductase [Rhodovulum sulfidophilum]|uniref:Oxidoreductase n=1 Tax=Rhodovulum sulfidophilum TaxID=35806 RepID=A0A2W5Q494_RHOSU|nr:MAG: oxidoreductase [Rhodovulum sulfidophilum]
MANVSIIGSGPAGCVLAYALLRDGHDVTLYSDRTPEDWLERSKPTGSAYLWACSIDIERELGMDHWSQDMMGGHGVHMDRSTHIGDPNPGVIRGLVEYGRRGCGIDQRLRVHRWLGDLESRGGKLVIESVTPERADAIAASSDLTVLAAGKAELGRIIPRDEARCEFDAPQRNVVMAVVRSKSGRHVSEWFADRWDLIPQKFNFYADAGEYFWGPYMHKTAGDTFAVLLEAKPGGPFDRFADVRSGEETIEIFRELARECAPWERHFIDDVEYVSEDPHGWLAGRVTPGVRRPFAKLPSGGLIMPIGDTAITFDPICGQGGNFANRGARFLAEQVTERGDRPFDEAWITGVFDRIWAFYGRSQCAFNNTFLKPLEPSAELVMRTALRSEEAANEFYYGLPHPESILPALRDMGAARAFAERHGVSLEMA